jgi:hypothetical protein
MEALVSSADIRLGSLTIRDGQYRYGVRFQSNAANVNDIRNLWLNHNGKLLKLGDIASVEVVPAPRSGMLTYDGKPSLSLAVIKQSDARMADLRRAMDSLLGAFKSDYPGVEFSIIRDQTLLLDYSINSLILNIIIGILLACAVIFLFMKDFRSPMLVALTIPFSLVFSMLLFRILGMSLNIISLSGLLLGVGMMTDNTLILVDNITGRRLRGEQLREVSLNHLTDVFGKAGPIYYQFSRGIDERPVIVERERKSVGCEHTFLEDLSKPSAVTIELYHTVIELAERIERSGFEGRTLTLKVKFFDFAQITRSETVTYVLKTKDKILPLAKNCWLASIIPSTDPFACWDFPCRIRREANLMLPTRHGRKDGLIFRIERKNLLYMRRYLQSFL